MKVRYKKTGSEAYAQTVTSISESYTYMSSLDLFIQKLLLVESNLVDGSGDIIL